MKSENLIILVGNVGKDIELKYTSGGTAVAKFTMATNERYKDKSGAWQDRTEWHNVTCWGRLAEIVSEYVQKGRTLYVKGKLRTDSWDDKESGHKRYMTYINASDVILLGNGNSNGASDPSGAADEEPEFASAGAGETWPF
jgi:single-strand DNA-binding protein